MTSLKRNLNAQSKSISFNLRPNFFPSFLSRRARNIKEEESRSNTSAPVENIFIPALSVSSEIVFPNFQNLELESSSPSLPSKYLEDAISQFDAASRLRGHTAEEWVAQVFGWRQELDQLYPNFEFSGPRSPPSVLSAPLPHSSMEDALNMGGAPLTKFPSSPDPLLFSDVGSEAHRSLGSMAPSTIQCVSVTQAAHSTVNSTSAPAQTPQRNHHTSDSLPSSRRKLSISVVRFDLSASSQNNEKRPLNASTEKLSEALSKSVGKQQQKEDLRLVVKDETKESSFDQGEEDEDDWGISSIWRKYKSMNNSQKGLSNWGKPVDWNKISSETMVIGSSELLKRDNETCKESITMKRYSNRVEVEIVERDSTLNKAQTSTCKNNNDLQNSAITGVIGKDLLKSNVTAASKEKLIEYLTLNIDSNFLIAFLMTFREFMTPEELFDLLESRYMWTLQKNGSSKIKKIVRVRIFKIVQQWLLDHFRQDFLNDNKLCNRFLDFIQNLRSCDYKDKADDSIVFETLNKLYKRLLRHYQKKSPEKENSSRCSYVKESPRPAMYNLSEMSLAKSSSSLIPTGRSSAPKRSIKDLLCCGGYYKKDEEEMFMEKPTSAPKVYMNKLPQFSWECLNSEVASSPVQIPEFEERGPPDGLSPLVRCQVLPLSLSVKRKHSPEMEVKDFRPKNANKTYKKSNIFSDIKEQPSPLQIQSRTISELSLAKRCFRKLRKYGRSAPSTPNSQSYDNESDPQQEQCQCSKLRNSDVEDSMVQPVASTSAPKLGLGVGEEDKEVEEEGGKLVVIVDSPLMRRDKKRMPSGSTANSRAEDVSQRPDTGYASDSKKQRFCRKCRSSELKSTNPSRNINGTPAEQTNQPFILKHRSKDVARAFWMIEREMFLKIDLSDLRNKANWENPTGSDNQTNIIRQIIDRVNMVYQWVITEIVSTEDLVERVQLVEKFIRIASKSYSLGNFATLSQIILALQSSPVSRLSKTWKKVGRYETRLFHYLLSFTSPLSNWKSLRDVMNERAEVSFQIDNMASSQGCIPFIGPYLFELTHISALATFIQADTPESSNNVRSLVNVRKLVAFAKTFQQMMKFQYLACRVEYTHLDSFLVNSVSHLRCLCNQDIMELSQKIEPELN